MVDNDIEADRNVPCFINYCVFQPSPALEKKHIGSIVQTLKNIDKKKSRIFKNQKSKLIRSESSLNKEPSLLI